MTGAAAEPRQGTICTFYSYKGGVGRTFALANVAAVISSWGYRVLCLDWDLEAPGLHLFFDKIAQSAFERGLVELIHDIAAGADVDWRAYTVDATQRDDAGTITIMPAGRLDDGYLARMQELDWVSLYEDADLGTRLEQLRDSWKAEYDFVLIDSRTGITDIGGICTVQLPDILVLLFTPNYQNVEGVIDVAGRAAVQRERLPFDRAQLPALPVVTRFEATVEVELARTWLEIFEKRLDDVFRVWTHKTVATADMLNHTRIPYVAHWSFGERLPVIEEGTRDPLGIGYAFETVAALIANRLESTELLVANRQSYVDSARRAALAARAETPQFEFDVVVSYDADDVEFGTELTAALAARGFRTWPPADETHPADAAIDDARAAVERSRNLVAVLTKPPTQFLEETYRQFLVTVLSEAESRVLVPVLRAASPEMMPSFLGSAGVLAAADRPAEAVADDIAERLWREAAAAGDARAGNNLGAMLARRGLGEEAERWLRQAAEAGYEPAMLNLGLGLAARGDEAAAEEWFRRGAATGASDALFNLGLLLERRSALEEAENAYRRAAEAGHAGAVSAVASLLAARGERTEAQRWSRRRAGAAETHLKTVSWALDSGDVVPFLGAGANAVGRLFARGWQPDSGVAPTQGDVASYLAHRFEADDPHVDLATIAQTVTQQLGLHALYDELHALLDADYRPNALHAFLGTLPSLCRRAGGSPSQPLIVTLNWDDSLERAFDDAGEEYDIVTYLADQRDRFLHRPAGRKPSVIADPTTYTDLPVGRRTIILKLLGSVDRTGSGWESFVVTEDQIDDYLTRTHVSQLLPVQVAAKLTESRQLFLGVAPDVRTVRTVLKRLLGSARRTSPAWAVQLEASPGARQFWQEQDVEIVDAPLDEYVEALRARIEALPPAPKAKLPPEPASTEAAVLPSSPYKGLVPYSEADAPFFFGREREREIVLSNLRASRLTILYGASGVGKTSLLRAGIATATPVVAFDQWRDEEAVSRLYYATLQAWDRDTRGPLLMLLDHFEEYFLYHGDRDTRGFALELAKAIDLNALDARVLISIREDALFRLDQLRAGIPDVLANLLRLDRLEFAAGREAIVRPLEAWNAMAVSEEPVQVQPALVDEVLQQTAIGAITIGGSGRGALSEDDPGHRVEIPYLQLVMEKIWAEERHAGSSVLRLETLHRLGGAERIVRTHVDATMDTLGRKEREIATRLFRYLVTPTGEKLALHPSDLAAFTSRRESEIVPVLDRLAQGDMRILRVVWSVDRPADEPAYEFFHQLLVPAVSDWLARHRRR